MTPSTYLIAVPLGLIAISGWLVKVESDSFTRSTRTSEIQKITKGKNTRIGLPSDTPQDPALSLDHSRFGWDSEPGYGGPNLGKDASFRPLGARSGASRAWLDSHTVGADPAAKADDLPEIEGYRAQPPEPDTAFLPVPEGSGFHITADEATKVDMGAEKVTFKGRVAMTSPQFHLTGEELVVHLGKGGASFKLVEARGSVKVQLVGVPEEKRYRGQSNFAVYDPNKGTLVMTGWPKIQGQGREIVAAEPNTRILLYPDTGKMHTEGRAQTRVARQFMEQAGAAPPR